jgi:hypothetical protein
MPEARASNLHKFSICKGQVGQESNLHPAVVGLLPFVQHRSGTYTRRLKMAHFDDPKYVEVHQRSPALGSNLGSNVANRAP